MNGDCVVGGGGEGGEGVCECWEGWRGERCSLCGGKVRMGEEGGRRWLAEAVGNYTANMRCTWLKESARQGASIRLHLQGGIMSLIIFMHGT